MYSIVIREFLDLSWHGHAAPCMPYFDVQPPPMPEVKVDHPIGMLL